MTLPPAELRAQLVGFRHKHAVPALGAAVVTRDGGVDVDVVGVRIRGGDDPVRLDDRWHIGSCGKSITAALYARLVEGGEAEWGARLQASPLLSRMRAYRRRRAGIPEDALPYGGQAGRLSLAESWDRALLAEAVAELETTRTVLVHSELAGWHEVRRDGGRTTGSSETPAA